MTAAVLVLILLFCIVLLPVSFVQLLYTSGMRLR